jgi:hypothetical protein
MEYSNICTHCRATFHAHFVNPELRRKKDVCKNCKDVRKRDLMAKKRAEARRQRGIESLSEVQQEDTASGVVVDNPPYVIERPHTLPTVALDLEPRHAPWKIVSGPFKTAAEMADMRHLLKSRGQFSGVRIKLKYFVIKFSNYYAYFLALGSNPRTRANEPSYHDSA